MALPPHPSLERKLEASWCLSFTYVLSSVPPQNREREETPAILKVQSLRLQVSHDSLKATMPQQRWDGAPALVSAWSHLQLILGEDAGAREEWRYKRPGAWAAEAWEGLNGS
jgi:hypothetical protein